MTIWLADKARQAYARIDPLKINVNAVTEVMSYRFAQRHNILALEVTDDEVVIASAQPFMYQWEGMLTQTLRGRRIRRVVANPADLSTLQLEFYTMARSVCARRRSGLRSLRHRQPRADARARSAQVTGRERCPHRQHRRLAAATTRSISVPVISTSNRGVKKG